MRVTRSMTTTTTTTASSQAASNASAVGTKQASKLASRNRKNRPSTPTVSVSVSVRSSFAVSKPSGFAASRPGKRPAKRAGKGASVIDEIDIHVLPHNLGEAEAQIIQDARVASRKVQNKRKSTSGEAPQKRLKQEVRDDDPDQVAKPTAAATNKKTAAKYGLTPGISPFPDYSHPTPQACEEVNRLLSTVHGHIRAPTKVPQPSLTVTGCGEVPSVLDALIRTVLSGATTGANSARAFKGLVDRFGILQSGIGKGSVDWNAVRTAPIGEVFEAMKSGGLATTKSKYIKEILNMVYEENLTRRNAFINSKQNSEDGSLQTSAMKNDSLFESQKEVEIALTDEHVLSLDWIHALDKEDAMLELIKYPGIGPKTAACVVLFCLQRPCFAVDTHIFRICKWLGWLPSADTTKRVTEIMAFSHLEVRIPDHLKYSLHQLLIRHGKSCPRCRAITGEKSDGWEKGCVIDHLVKRTGKRKGGI